MISFERRWFHVSVLGLQRVELWWRERTGVMESGVWGRRQSGSELAPGEVRVLHPCRVIGCNLVS